jgi:hypothetical protein
MSCDAVVHHCRHQTVSSSDNVIQQCLPGLVNRQHLLNVPLQTFTSCLNNYLNSLISKPNFTHVWISQCPYCPQIRYAWTGNSERVPGRPGKNQTKHLQPQFRVLSLCVHVAGCRYMYIRDQALWEIWLKQECISIWNDFIFLFQVK